MICPPRSWRTRVILAACQTMKSTCRSSCRNSSQVQPVLAISGAKSRLPAGCRLACTIIKTKRACVFETAAFVGTLHTEKIASNSAQF